MALPLQRAPRDEDNSVLVDDDLAPWTDQWAVPGQRSPHRSCRGRVRRAGHGTTWPSACHASAAAGGRRRRALDDRALAAFARDGDRQASCPIELVSANQMLLRTIATVETDQLQQESGHYVLRFLADDVGKELNTVLDVVLRAWSRRRT